MEIDDLYQNSRRLAMSVEMGSKRYLYDQINWEASMICVKGARGVGKTTMLLQRVRQVPNWGEQALYVSLDDLWFAQNRLLDVADYHYKHGGTHLMVDEVHRYPLASWSQELKNIYDRYPGFKVVFTGSSILELSKSQADLSRRCQFHELPGLSFREYLNLECGTHFPAVTLDELLSRHVTLALEITAQVKVLPHFNRYLQQGYYPFYREAGIDYAATLRQVVNNIMEQDVPAVGNVEYASITRMKRLLYIIAQNSPITVNLSHFAASLECDRQTVLKLLKIMQRARLVNLLFKGKNVMSQLAKPEKVYLENPNMMWALSPEANVGNMRETFFANQLGQNHKLTYSGEGDFLIDGQLTFEVGGHRKSFAQIKDLPGSYLAVDDMETGQGHRVPLWLLGFTY